MTDDLPAVTVIVPCRNEERFIGPCLKSILNCDYPKESLEILVVDGMSTDGTPGIVQEYARQSRDVRLVANPRQTAPAAMNIGLAHAHGAVIVRMDAHAQYPRDYIRQCVETLIHTTASNVGGICQTLPSAPTAKARAIAYALSSPVGVGNSYFRIGTSGPRWVDTVPFGCFRKELFDQIGQFDELLRRNQDDEFNLRISRSGGKLLLLPDVVTKYYALDVFRTRPNVLPIRILQTLRLSETS